MRVQNQQGVDGGRRSLVIEKHAQRLRGGNQLRKVDWPSAGRKDVNGERQRQIFLFLIFIAAIYFSIVEICALKRITKI